MDAFGDLFGGEGCSYAYAKMARIAHYDVEPAVPRDDPDRCVPGRSLIQDSRSAISSVPPHNRNFALPDPLARAIRRHGDTAVRRHPDEARDPASLPKVPQQYEDARVLGLQVLAAFRAPRSAINAGGF